ncbi:MAG: hypothetical protein ACE37H_11735 [Phycisphaeraceae bacterium]
MRTPRPITALILALGCLTCAPPAHAQDRPAEPDPPAEQAQPQPDIPRPEPGPTLVVRDLFVIQADKYGERANDPVQVRSTLTTPIPDNPKWSRRRLVLDDGKGYANQPMPLGLISFQGEIKSPMTVTIELLGEQAQVHAHYPKDAQTKEQFIRWLSVKEATPNQRAQPIGGGGHWLEALRGSDDRLWIASRDPLRKERFMLYDASFAFKPALELALNQGAYTAKSARAQSQAPPLTMLVHHRPDVGWSANSVAGPWDGQQAELGTKPENDDAYAPNPMPVLKPLADLLAERGYTAVEIETALAMVASAGLENSSMSLVYVMPAGALDAHVRLTLKPEPDRVVRTAIVVLTNADPDLGSRIDQLIAQLGSDRWLERARAHEALEAMGQAAIKQLQAHREDDDPEIAFRAQQLLETYDLKTEQDR